MEREKLTALVTKAKAGDRKALDDLFTQTYNDVYYFALKTVKDEDMACDITQETFVTVFKTINSLQDPASYVAWCRQITYRHCLHYLGRNREVTVEEEEDGSSIFDTVAEENAEFIPDAALDKEDFRKTVMKMVDSLSAEQRTAILLYYYDELSVREIAQIQGISEGTVKSRLNYGRKAIKASVEDYEKKNGVKLHSFALLPLLLWLFSADAKTRSMPGAKAKAVGKAAASAARKTAKAAGKLWQKILAGIAAMAVAGAGGTAAVVMLTQPWAEDAPHTETQTISGTWTGKGKIIGDPYSYHTFTIQIFQMDETQITGSVTLLFTDGTESSVNFSGTGQKELLWKIPTGRYRYTLELDAPDGLWSTSRFSVSQPELIYDSKDDTVCFEKRLFVMKKMKRQA